MMKKNNFIILIILLISAGIFSACKKTEKLDATPAKYEIKFNETIFIQNSNNMIISFVGITDNRCPKSTCHLCWGSQATIKINISNSESENIEIDLSIIGCVDELDNESTLGHVDTLGYRFILNKLSPYPDKEPIKEDDYTATIKITRNE